MKIKMLSIFLVLLISACGIAPGEYVAIPATNVTPDYVYCELGDCWSIELRDTFPTQERLECILAMHDATVYAYPNSAYTYTYSGFSTVINFVISGTEEWASLREPAAWVKVDGTSVSYDVLNQICLDVPVIYEPNIVVPTTVPCIATATAKVNFRDRPTIYSTVLFQLAIGETGVYQYAEGNWYVLEVRGIVGYVYSAYVNLSPECGG